jgi:hypothetical protein
LESTFVVIASAVTKVLTPRSPYWGPQAPCGIVRTSPLDTRSQNVVSPDCGDNRTAAKKMAREAEEIKAGIRLPAHEEVDMILT